MNPFAPQLRGLNLDPRVAQEIEAAFDRLFNFYENRIKEIESKTSSTSFKVEEIRSSKLFSGALANPLINPTSGNLAEVAQQGQAIDVSQIPNLPASKITSGNLAIARHATNILKTDDGLNEDVTGAPNVNTGFITIKDVAGNVKKIMTCA